MFEFAWECFARTLKSIRERYKCEEKCVFEDWSGTCVASNLVYAGHGLNFHLLKHPKIPTHVKTRYLMHVLMAWETGYTTALRGLDEGISETYNLKSFDLPREEPRYREQIIKIRLAGHDRFTRFSPRDAITLEMPIRTLIPILRCLPGNFRTENVK
jgi:hypothetical protein